MKRVMIGSVVVICSLVVWAFLVHPAWSQTDVIAAILGRGTANFIPEFTAPNRIGDSVIFQDAGGNVGIGTTSPNARLFVNQTGNATGTNSEVSGVGATVSGDASGDNSEVHAVFVRATGNATNTTPGVGSEVVGLRAVVDGTAIGPETDVTGVVGRANATSGNAQGVRGVSESADGVGVRGRADAISGNAIGVLGSSKSTNGRGVVGRADATSGNAIGVRGVSESTGGTGVEGSADATSGITNGVVGRTNSPDGAGVVGISIGGGGGVLGISNTVGVHGVSLSQAGVLGASPNEGVQGTSQICTGPLGLACTATAGIGVHAITGSGGILLLGTRFEGTTPSATFTNVFRVDSAGKVFADGGFQPFGADFAEALPVTGDRSEYEPADLLVIDPKGKSRLALSRQAYSTLVAGIFSTKPGVLGTTRRLGEPSRTDEVPLAVVGIVPCKVTAENGPIAVGDLLVTSSTPGHAMRGTDRARMLGAVVGKALEPLKEGTGIIQVLVTLQ